MTFLRAAATGRIRGKEGGPDPVAEPRELPRPVFRGLKAAKKKKKKTTATATATADATAQATAAGTRKKVDTGDEDENATVAGSTSGAGKTAKETATGTDITEEAEGGEDTTGTARPDKSGGDAKKNKQKKNKKKNAEKEKEEAKTKAEGVETDKSDDDDTKTKAGSDDAKEDIIKVTKTKSAKIAEADATTKAKSKDAVSDDDADSRSNNNGSDAEDKEQEEEEGTAQTVEAKPSDKSSKADPSSGKVSTVKGSGEDNEDADGADTDNKVTTEKESKDDSIGGDVTDFGDGKQQDESTGSDESGDDDNAGVNTVGADSKKKGEDKLDAKTSADAAGGGGGDEAADTGKEPNSSDDNTVDDTGADMKAQVKSDNIDSRDDADEQGPENAEDQNSGKGDSGKADEEESASDGEAKIVEKSTPEDEKSQADVSTDGGGIAEVDATDTKDVVSKDDADQEDTEKHESSAADDIDEDNEESGSEKDEDESNPESTPSKASETAASPFGAIDSKLTATKAVDEGKAKDEPNEFDDGEKGDDMKPTISIKGEDETPSKQSKAEATSGDDNMSVDAFGRAKDEISEKGSTDELEQQVGKVDGKSGNGKPSKIASKSETGAGDAIANYEAKVKDVSKSEQEKEETTDELKQAMQSEETTDDDTKEDAKAAAQAKLGILSSSIVRDDSGTVVGEKLSDESTIEDPETGFFNVSKDRTTNNTQVDPSGSDQDEDHESGEDVGYIGANTISSNANQDPPDSDGDAEEDDSGNDAEKDDSIEDANEDDSGGDAKEDDSIEDANDDDSGGEDADESLSQGPTTIENNKTSNDELEGNGEEDADSSANVTEIIGVVDSASGEEVDEDAKGYETGNVPADKGEIAVEEDEAPNGIEEDASSAEETGDIVPTAIEDQIAIDEEAGSTNDSRDEGVEDEKKDDDGFGDDVNSEHNINDSTLDDDQTDGDVGGDDGEDGAKRQFFTGDDLEADGGLETGFGTQDEWSQSAPTSIGSAAEPSPIVTQQEEATTSQIDSTETAAIPTQHFDDDYVSELGENSGFIGLMLASLVIALLARFIKRHRGSPEIAYSRVTGDDRYGHGNGYAVNKKN